MVDADTITSAALVVATGGLVVVTIIYAFYTKRLADATERARQDQSRAREEQTRPIIKASFQFIGPVAGALRCQNIGTGAAVELDATIEAFPQTAGWKRQWKEPLLVPNGFRDFFLPSTALEQIQASIEYITVDGECKNALGEKAEIHDRINLREYLTGLIGARVRLVEAPDEVMRDIYKTAKEIKGSLDGIKDVLKKEDVD